MRSRSLSPTEARVVLALEGEGRDDVSLDEIQALAKVRRGHARTLAHGLVAKGWLHPLRRGRYLLNPSRYGPESVPETDPLRIGSRLVRPYYFGFATAAELWGLLLRPGRTYYLVSTIRASVRLPGPATFRLVRVAEARFFGRTELERRGATLSVSDPERTVIDCLDRPELVGGLSGAAEVFARAKPGLRWGRLSRYLAHFGNASVGRRVGYLSEHVRPTVVAPLGFLRRLLPEADGAPWVPLGPPGTYGRRGPRDRRWKVVVNVPERELLADVETR